MWSNLGSVWFEARSLGPTGHFPGIRRPTRWRPSRHAAVWEPSPASSCNETGSGGYSDGHAIGNPVWGQVVIRQLLILVALGDHADDGVEVLTEPGHGLLYWLLDEMLLRVHAQEQLRPRQTETG